MNTQSKTFLRIGVSVGTAVFILATFLSILPSVSASITASAGDIIVHEIMQNPSAVSDTNGEWFEVHNTTGTNIDINGWTIKDNGSDSHVINNGSPLEVPANGYLVLGINAETVTNGGITIDYVYSGITLGNGDDEIILLDGSLKEIDRVEYDGGPEWPDPTGKSMALKFPALDNNVGGNWCEASTTYGDGDLGTPGAANDCPIAITKEAQPSTNVGYQENVTYTVVLMNGTTVDETAVLFTDTLPISTTFKSWVEKPAGASEVGNEITWTGTVTAGKSITFTFTADQTADYSETITNTAEFSNTTAGTAQASFTVENEPLPVDLAVEKTAPVYAVEDEIINYTVVISNDGSVSVDNVLFTDTLPAEIAYSSADLAYTSSPSVNVYVWDLGTMASGTAVTINLTGTITNTISATTLVSNTAEVSTSTIGDNLANNSAEAPTTIYPIVPIATARAGSNGDIFAVEGKITVVPGTYSPQEWALQDASGGISVYFTPPPTVELGDTVRLLGNRGAYNNQEQFTSNLFFRKISSGPEVTPIPYTTGDVDSGVSEGWLVSVSGTVGDLNCPSNLTVDDGSGAVAIYIDSDTGIENLCDLGVQNGDSIKVVGFSTQYKTTYQIKPRRPSDIDLGVLQIRKEAPQLVFPGSLITYTLTANNQTGDTLTNVVISDIVPANTTFAYSLDGGAESGGTVTWNIANLAHASNVSVQFAVTATNSIGKVVNDTYAVYASNHITPVTSLPTTTFIDTQLHIYQIQGEGLVSPIVDQEVTVSGEVVADFQGNSGMRGFFIQDPVGDGNLLTSDGIFVYDYYLSPGVDVNVGDMVTVTGTAAEYQNNTQISNVSAIVTETNTLSIAPTLVTLPETTNGDLERYEGMYVTLPQTMTVAQNYFLGQFGQVTLSANGRLYQPTNVYPPASPEAVDLADSNARNLIVLDDASTVRNPNPVPYIGISGTLRAGDTTTDLIGVLDEGSISSQSVYDYRLQPLSAVTFNRVNERINAPEDVGGRLQIASFNVLNYFTTIGSSEICGPSQDLECRGADTADEFVRQRTKIITAIVSIDADVVGLMEIENNEIAAITDLVTGLNEEAGAGTYAFIDTGYIGGDAIKVAMIYQPAKVTPVGTTAVLTDVFPFNSNTRPPLAQAFVENKTGQEFIVVVNHFKSKGSACTDDPDLGDGQGECNLTRVQAANELVAWLNTDPTGTGDPDIFIIGDLNSYAQEDPITTLKGHGYTNLIEQFTGTWAYSYVFDGQSGYLDHGLATNSAQTSVTGVTEWHINADEPSALDYNNYNPDYLFQPDAFRASDHDPILIGVSLKWFTFMPIMFK